MLSRLSFEHRVLATIGGLVTLCVGALLALTVTWMNSRTEEDVTYRLARGTGTLKRLHASASTLRARRFQSLAVEPRFRALAEVGDRDTLKFAAEEVRKELGCSAFGFLAADGRTLAWNGIGEQEVPAAARPLLGAAATAPASETLIVGGKAYELVLIVMRTGEAIVGYLAAASALDRAVLQDYAAGVGARVELWADGHVTEASLDAPPEGAVVRSVDVPISGTVKFVVVLDVGAVAAPFRDALRAIALIAGFCLVAALVAGFFMARLIARPLGDLASNVRAVEEGMLSVRVEENVGAPELRELARSFNRMVLSLVQTQKELREYAHQLEDRLRQAEETRTGGKPPDTRGPS